MDIRPFIHAKVSELVKYVLKTTNFPFLLISRPLKVNCCDSSPSVLNNHCQSEIVTPLLYIKERPEPTALPDGKVLYPLISPVHLLSLSVNTIL